MQKFPLLSTQIKDLVLQPLQEKHLDFLVALLSKPSIQKTLFRSKTKITREKQYREFEKMYEKEQPTVITYVLTKKAILSEKYIGYVKIKLIDWTVQSCYISVAIDDAPEYRGKGYAKATYESFFAYLFSIGLKKIYGRTYENNIATIKLNIATGFRLIGRQKNFVTYPDHTSLDALLFEKLATDIDTSIPNKDIELQNTICNKINAAKSPYSLEEISNDFAIPPLHEYFLSLQQEQINPKRISDLMVKQGTFDSNDTKNKSLLESNLPAKWGLENVHDDALHIDFSKRTIQIPTNFEPDLKLVAELIIIAQRYENAVDAGFPLLGYLLTEQQYRYLNQSVEQILSGKSNEVSDTFYSSNAVCSANENSLSYLFLGTTLRYNWKAMLPIISVTSR